MLAHTAGGDTNQFILNAKGSMQILCTETVNLEGNLEVLTFKMHMPCNSAIPFLSICSEKSPTYLLRVRYKYAYFSIV